MTFSTDQTFTDDHFKSFYFEYYAMAHRTAVYILKDTDAAEDVVQTVFLKLWDKREKLPTISNPKAYVLQMARNGALDALKKENSLEEQCLSLEYANEEHEVSGNSEEIRQAIERAVSALSPKCRLVFSLSRFEGLTNPEIAEHLDISIRTVETQISNALKLFRTDLKHYFIEFLVWGLLLSRVILGEFSELLF